MTKLIKHPIFCSIAFLFGLIVIFAGVIVLRSSITFDFSVPLVQKLLWPIQSYQPVFLGILISIAGTLIVGFTSRTFQKDEVTSSSSQSLISIKIDHIAVACLVIATISYSWLYWDLSTRHYSHLDIFHFFLSIFLVGFVVSRFDSHSRTSRIFARTDVYLVLLLFFGAVALNSIGLDHWNFAWYGDENNGVVESLRIAKGEISWNFFNLNSVDYTHPQLDFALKGLTMSLFGMDAFGLRFSGVLISAIGAVFIYLLGTVLFGRFAGFTAGIVIGSSHSLMSFNRMAWNYQHVIVYTTLAVLLFCLAWKKQKAVYFFATGAALGFCLYTFRGAVLLWPIVGLMQLIVFLRKPSWNQFFFLTLIALGFILVIIPAFLFSPFHDTMHAAMSNTAILYKESKVYYYSHQIIQHVLSFGVDQADRYIGGPLVDAVTGTLLLAGFAIAVARRNRNDLLVLLWICAGVLFVSLSSNTPVPQAKVGRLMFVLPAIALLAGSAAIEIGRVLNSNLKIPKNISRFMLICLVLSIPPLNLYQLFVDSPLKYPGHDLGTYLKANRDYPDRTLIEVGTNPSPEHNIPNIIMIYPKFAAKYQYITLDQFQPPRTESTNEELPVYIVSQRNEAILDTVKAKLPPLYNTRIQYRYRDQAYKIFLLVPEGV
jgi:4-amino-4-deoxy-L-arabinose transferase-like glycosyltransferase